MFEIGSALVPPLMAGGASVTGAVWSTCSEARAKAAEHAERKLPGGDSPPE
ncbi:hypothetical protein [Streptosporangium sp. NPDC003464]